MVKCDKCGKTDGCSFHDYGDQLLCFRCYRAARDEEYELQQRAKKMSKA